MKPLVFLTLRSTVNGIRRALTSPRRLIGISVLLLYWFNFISRSISPSGRGHMETVVGIPATELPSAAVIESIVFGFFVFLSFFMLMSSLSPRGGFRPADVDVLFPTPINPKIVLVFRIVRDTSITLFIPLIFSIFARPVTLPLETFFRNHPAQGQLIAKAASVTWLLLVLAWTSLGYAFSLFVNRSDERSDRNKKYIDGTIIGVTVLAFSYIAFRLRMDPSWHTALELTQMPAMRAVFFTATLATSAVMAPFVGSLLMGVVGFGGLIAVIACSILLALTQVEYLYDQAAAKGFDTVKMRNLQRTGDTYGIAAEQARKGKRPGGRIAARIGRLRVRGGAALLWKEMLLQARGALWQYVVFGPVTAAMVLGPLYGTARSGSLMTERIMLLVFLAMSVLTLSMQTATSGFIELLKRVDFQKPLPFSPAAVVFWEVVPKALPTAILCGLASLGALAVDPRLWDVAIGAVFMAPSLSLVFTSVVLLVTVLFPDVDDATQRSFRGIMMMLGSAIASSPMLATVAVLVYLGINGLVIAALAVAINIGVTAGLSAIGGNLYASYNPSE